MTNYNEELDDILYDYWARHRNCDKGCQSPDDGEITKQAITSLIKELVAEAKPKKHNTDVGDAYQRTFCGEYNKGIDQFEQNLLKGLEEV